jgi:4-carboxymuconolactone decarboxylase
LPTPTRARGSAMQPRIEPMKREDAAPQVETLFRLMDAMGNPPPNMHLTFGKHPELYAKWLPFAVHIMPSSSLAPRDRQILILRCAFNWRCGYAWAQHARISKRVGALGDGEIAAIEGSSPFAWDAKEAALIGACDDCARSMQIGEAVWAELARHYSEKELLDVAFTIGQYALISIALKSLGVQLDAGLTLPAWADKES